MASPRTMGAPGPGRLSPRLLSGVLVVIVAILVVGALRLTARVTSLELRVESLNATARAGSRPGPPAEPGPQFEPAPPLERGLAEPVERAEPQAPTPARAARNARGGSAGGGKASAEVVGAGDPPREDRERASAVRDRMHERLDHYVELTGYDEDVTIALEDEIDRSIEAHQSALGRMQRGQMSEERFRGAVRDDLITVYDNVADLLGEDESTMFIEEVLGVPAEELERMGVLDDGEPPPEKDEPEE
jgi:hypothetical protein